MVEAVDLKSIQSGSSPGGPIRRINMPNSKQRISRQKHRRRAARQRAQRREELANAKVKTINTLYREGSLPKNYTKG